DKYVRPAAVNLEKVGAHYAVSSLYEQPAPESRVYCYHVTSIARERFQSGDVQLLVGQARIRSLLTTESAETTYAVLYFGDHQVHGGIRSDMTTEEYKAALVDLR